MDQGSREGRTFCFDVIISATIFARRKSAGSNMIGLNQQRKSHVSSRSFGRWVRAHFPERRLVIEPTNTWPSVIVKLPLILIWWCSYNPGQNYLRKFSPSCPLSYATKLFPKRRLCGKKTPSPNSMLLPTNAQGSGFLLNTQQHCFQGKGEREEPVQLRCLEKCCPSIQLSEQFCPRL